MAITKPKEGRKNQFILSSLINFILTEYSSNVSKCLTNWTKKIQDCNGDTNCFEEAGKELRGCLDAAFPPSTKLEFESDKINYMLSTIFFLSNRLTKAMTGLSEMDKVIDNFVKKENQRLDDDGSSAAAAEKRSNETMGSDLNDILAKYF
jgi:Mg2+ and Co2+ transporter CorA